MIHDDETPDMMSALGESRDRITAMLRQSNPLLNVGIAALSSVGGGNFAQNLSTLDRGDQSRAMGVYQLLAGEQRMKQSEAREQRYERQFEQSNKANLTRQLQQSIEMYGGDNPTLLANEVYKRLAAEKQTTGQLNPERALTLVPQIASELRINPKKESGGAGGAGTMTERFLQQLPQAERDKAMRVQLGLEPRATNAMEGVTITGPGGETIQVGASRAQTAAMEADKKIREASVSHDQFASAVNRLDNALSENQGTGFNTWINNPRDPKAVKVNTAFNNMLALLRGETLYNTGVLQKGELEWLRSILLDPQGLRGALSSREAMAAQLEQMRAMARHNFEAVKRNWEPRLGANPAQASPPMPTTNQNDPLERGNPLGLPRTPR